VGSSRWLVGVAEGEDLEHLLAAQRHHRRTVPARPFAQNVETLQLEGHAECGSLRGEIMHSGG
jgi:hypothetical protein